MAAGLIGTGIAYRNQAIRGLEQSANLEQRRNQMNALFKQQHKQQVMQDIGTGAGIGMMFGPWGAVVGGVAGLLAGEVF